MWQQTTVIRLILIDPWHLPPPLIFLVFELRRWPGYQKCSKLHAFFIFFGPKVKLCILQALTAFEDFTWKKNIPKKMQNLQFSPNLRLHLSHVLHLNFTQTVIFWLCQVQENIFSTLMIFLAPLEAARRAL